MQQAREPVAGFLSLDAWRINGISVALFWLAWGAARWSLGDLLWLHMCGRLWCAYACAHLLLWALARWRPSSWLPAFLFTPASALFGACLWGLVNPRGGAAPAGWVQMGLALGFTLLMIYPLLLARWRELGREQALQAKSAQLAALASLQRDRAQAELKLLQAQVEPHFLYNTLAGLQQLMRCDAKRAERMLGRLHDYLRLSLPVMRSPMSSVGQELNLAQAFLELMQMRFGARLSFELCSEPALADLPFPPLVLGTLLENAMKHGIEPSLKGGFVRVLFWTQGQTLRLKVEDQGVGLQAKEGGGGLGLSNLRERLRAMWGDDAGLDVQSRASGGVQAEVWIPLRNPCLAVEV